MEHAEQPTPRLRYSTRGLLLLTLVAAIATGSCVYIYNSIRANSRYGPYATIEEWPKALVGLIGENDEFTQDVDPYDVGSWIDHRSIWRIKGGSPLRDLLFEKYDLKPTDLTHPKTQKLIECFPSDWETQRWADCTWYATPGYGTIHIEGIDLFLIAEEDATGDLIVLHEWIF